MISLESLYVNDATQEDNQTAVEKIKQSIPCVLHRKVIFCLLHAKNGLEHFKI